MHTGRAVPLDRSDVDTDQIIPAEYLKRVERTGFGPFLFDSWRADPNFVLDRPEYAGASILLTGAELRGRLEPRARGVGARGRTASGPIVAPSFADIFRNNCGKIGLLPVELPVASVRALMDAVVRRPHDADHRRPRGGARHRPRDRSSHSEVDPYTRWRLLEGLDDIGLTLRHADAIDVYERSRPLWRPSIPAR